MKKLTVLLNNEAGTLEYQTEDEFKIYYDDMENLVISTIDVEDEGELVAIIHRNAWLAFDVKEIEERKAPAFDPEKGKIDEPEKAR